MVKKSFLFLVVLFLSFHIFPATMSPRVRQVPKDLQEQIFLNPKDNIVALAKFLAGAGDASSKMKNLHDWICDNIAYDCDAFTEQEIQQYLYSIINNPELTKKENTLRQQRFFAVFYNLLFGTDKGPRLYLFLCAINKDDYIGLLKF